MNLEQNPHYWHRLETAFYEWPKVDASLQTGATEQTSVNAVMATELAPTFHH